MSSRDSTGFGICGHLNTFQSGIRCGNWVEDLIGAELAQRPRAATQVKSETGSNFVNPALVPDKSAKCPEYNKDEIILNSWGLPYDTMFSHYGPRGPDPSNQFVTMNQMLYTGKGGVRSDVLLQSHKKTLDQQEQCTAPPPQRDLEKFKNEAEARSAKISKGYVSTTRGAYTDPTALSTHSSHNTTKGTFTKSFGSGSFLKRC